jgi:S-adenosylmethionine:tRNA ribosyltransferase-isomerase
MQIGLFDYHLEQDRIAQEPAYPRDRAKLMFVNRKTGKIEDGLVSDLIKKLGTNDLLVFNHTKVIPARLFGQKSTGGKVELLLTKQINENTWEAISTPGLKAGQKLEIGVLKAEVVGRNEEIITLKFADRGEYLRERIFEFGKTPIPPYIHSLKTERELRRIYQTVYAKREGDRKSTRLHFTKEMMIALRDKGIQLEFVTLHIGLGTFRSVKTEKIEDHQMHLERFSLDEETARRLNQAKTDGKNIISVGTTTTRVLESCADESGILSPREGETGIFIYPPYKFKFVDKLMTNFHLPKSTLLMLVSAFVSAPNAKERFTSFKKCLVGKAYAHAIEKEYRFFSFGDAMLIS